MNEDPIAADARAAVPDYGTFGPDPHGWLEDDFELAPGHPPFAPARGFAHGQHCRPARALVHRMREYARHAPMCAYAPTYPDAPVATCDCGFDAVLGEYDRWGAT